MSHYEVNQFPIEHFSLNSIQLTVLIVGLVEFLLLQLLIDRKRIHNFFLGLRTSTQSQLIGPDGSKHQADFKPSDKQEKRVDQMENPNLEEVKEAFDVFDSNRDGFIDAEELQKVLCALGLKEGSEMENCRRMIGLFDENGDGRIDFDEFVKFMESSLC
ncbi:UNVERIFIED_CONTAM: putative calcium-binding protein CML46 [Sesamum radiatum]|uniref:Calcium-binding protein CML46 n=1 Tax=Sesamum radiatum TaxID=300843 RepID=A0AAW2VRI4_SESRA